VILVDTSACIDFFRGRDPMARRRNAELDHHDQFGDSRDMARSYPVHEAKAKLSEILRRVKRGRSVTISERGRGIAQVVPVTRGRDLAARLDDLERDGLIRRGRGGIKTIVPLARRRGGLARFLASRG
jgi:prevent-host-death family protein